MTTEEHPTDASEMLRRVRALAPMIAEHAEQAENDRKPVDQVIAALERTGIFKSYVPQRFGGYEIDIDTFIDAGLAVSESCTSTGWVTTFYMEHNWMLAQFSPETQEKVLGSKPYILAPASISPTGTATQVDDGYVVSGRWGWGTGVMHADWILLNGVVEGGEGFDIRLFLVPRSEIEVLDTWDCAGMAGTGSNDMVAKDVFVPRERSEPLMDMALGRGSGSVWHGSPCFRHPMLPLLAIAAAVPSLGAARRAVSLYVERLGSRTVYGTLSKQAERASSQIRLGHAAAQVLEAETLLRDVGRRLTAWGDREEVCPPIERALYRLQIAHVVERCRDVVRRVMEDSGAGAHLKPHPMQRIHRDIHTLSCHTIFDLDIGAENHGRLLLGLDPTSPV